MRRETIDKVLDSVYEEFASIVNAANLGTKNITLQEPTGSYPFLMDFIFIPTVSGNEGYLISKGKLQAMPKAGQVERSISYTNIRGLERIKGPDDVNRLFRYHLYPPGREKVGIVKIAGLLYHFTLEKTQEPIQAHIVEEPKYDFDTPLGAIVLEELRLDERFTKLKFKTYHGRTAKGSLGFIIMAEKKKIIYTSDLWDTVRD